jgi:hypothetical protein
VDFDILNLSDSGLQFAIMRSRHRVENEGYYSGRYNCLMLIILDALAALVMHQPAAGYSGHVTLNGFRVRVT